MSADGSGLRRLATGAETNGAPSWSPDGARVVFARFERHGGAFDSGIVVAKADGSGVWPVSATLGAARTDGDHDPRWSPDGTRIAFTRNGSVHVMNPDGSGPVLLARSAGTPSWSPDGARLAYCCAGRRNHGGIFVVSSDGSGVRRLTKGGHSPSWSPDGSSIAFESMG